MNINKCFQFKKISEDTTEILIYGEIRKADLWDKFLGDDPSRVDSYSFADMLGEIDTPNILVRINSYGGVVSEGLAIYNLLKSCGKSVETICDGFACSAASVIFCAGEKRTMPKSSLLLIHNAWTYGVEGDANDLRKVADDLEKITQPSVEVYKAVSNLSEDKIKELMNAETWITADEAKDWGFATEVKELEAKQSIETYYMAKLVAENKRLKNQINESVSEPEVKKGWNAFFDTKN